jgi:hypothetical protein
MMRTPVRLSLQPLDDRLTPATFAATTVGGTLTVTQTAAAVGAISIIDNPAAGTVTVDDDGDANPAQVFNTTGRPSLSVRLLPADTTAVDYQINSPRAGSVGIRLNNTSPRTLNLAGGAQIGGSLTVTGGNGGLDVEETGVAALHVTGNATFTGGSVADTLNLGVAGTSIGGTLTLTRFNTVATSSGDTVGGNLVFNAAGEATANVLRLLDTEVVGSLTYTGGPRADSVLLNGTTARVDRNVTVALGTQLGAEFSQLLEELGAGNIIGGTVRVTGGLLGTEGVTLDGTVNGAVSINLGGGTNSVFVLGLFNGPSFDYTGGAGADSINYGPLDGSAHARCSARLGAGSDLVFFGTATANPSFAFIDFGAGADTFSGTLNFSGTFLNLP